MKKIIPTSTMFFQFVIAFVVLFIIYLISALLDMDDFDLISTIGFLIFQPFIGIILTSLTIVICIIVGLPIRLIPKLHIWWSRKPFLIFLGVSVGLILISLSLNSNFMELEKVMIDDEGHTKKIPNTQLALTGWFLTAFSLLHFYPETIIIWLKKKIWTNPATKR